MPTDPARDAERLTGELGQLERRRRALESALPGAGVQRPGERDAEQLRQALRDLAEDQRELRCRLADVVSLLEGRPPSLSSPAPSLARRAARFALRLARGAARRLTREIPELRAVERPPPPGIDIEAARRQAAAVDRRSRRRELGVPDDALLVVMAADLVAGERPEDFVALAHRLRDDERFVFLLAGDGPLAAAVHDLAGLLASRRLLLRPPPAALPELLTAGDLYCSTAESHAFPDALLTALALGLPAVATAPEILEQGPCGVAVQWPGDLEAFAEALRSLADPADRQRLGERGRAVAAERYPLAAAAPRQRPGSGP